jgi:GMP synthase-like glutamine amidotransferase
VTAVRVLVLANAAEDDPGMLGEALLDRGAELVVAHREGGPLPAIDGFDAVLTLGSDWSVYWPHVEASVEREADLLRTAVAEDIPVLAVCFGAQVLAYALGGQVERAPRPEVGWYVVDTDDPDLVPPGPYVEWHSDRIQPPPGARVVARTDVGPQAYVLGPALALQFHPETGPDVVRRWCATGHPDLAAAGTDPEAFVAESVRREPEARARAYAIVDAFLARVARRVADADRHG